MLKVFNWGYSAVYYGSVNLPVFVVTPDKRFFEIGVNGGIRPLDLADIPAFMAHLHTLCEFTSWSMIELVPVSTHIALLPAWALRRLDLAGVVSLYSMRVHLEHLVDIHPEALTLALRALSDLEF